MSASEPAAGDLDVAPAPAPAAKRPPVVRYLLQHPFSVVLSLVILGTGIGFGTLWGRFPQELAAGILTTGQLKMWWTPVTALLIPDSAIGAVLAIALMLTVGAYAERVLGTLRAVIVFFVTGILGILAGIGFETLAATWGSTLADLPQLELVLDPTIGIFGVVMAGSAFAPALFRRRIRLIGFAVLVMFVLYAGDTDSLYRLIAALLGLAAGAILVRGTTRAAWYRSSYRESRTLVAAIVAVAGLGPLVVLISGSLEAPLGLVVSGFAQLDANQVISECLKASSTCDEKQLTLALIAGPGPFLLSLVPLALALVAAWGLRTGRRSAWVLGICTNLATAILTAISLGAVQLLDVKTESIVGPEFTVLVALATLVPVAVIVLLGVTWRLFQVGAPRRALRQFVLTVVIAFVVLALVYPVVGFIDQGAFLDEVTFGTMLADILRPFIPGGFVTDVPFAAVPLEGAPLFVFQWVGVVFWAIFIIAMIRLYRATGLRRNAADEERFRTLLKRGGGGTLGFMGTWPGNEYWFTPDGEAAVAYRVINGVALTMSDPVCAAGDGRETIEGFVQFCEAQGWSACFYSFHEKYLPIFESFGWQWMSVGEETVLDLPGLELAGKAWQKVRQPLNRGQREGVTTLWSTWQDLPAHFAAEIEAVSEEWVANKKLPEMGFTLGGMEELKDPDVGIFLAINKDGGIEATTSWLPSWTDGKITGWTIDFMRRGDGAMSGIMEFVIASAALHMKEQGALVMSLSGAPLATKPGEEVAEPTVMDRLLAWLGDMLEPAYGFTSLFKFKSKFNPRYETIYMAYADPMQLATIGMAIGNAYLPHATGKEYLALVQTITSRGGDH